MILVAKILPYAQIILSVILVLAVCSTDRLSLGELVEMTVEVFITLAEVLKSFSLFVYCLWHSFALFAFFNN